MSLYTTRSLYHFTPLGHYITLPHSVIISLYTTFWTKSISNRLSELYSVCLAWSALHITSFLCKVVWYNLFLLQLEWHVIQWHVNTICILDGFYNPISIFMAINIKSHWKFNRLLAAAAPHRHQSRTSYLLFVAWKVVMFSLLHPRMSDIQYVATISRLHQFTLYYCGFL